MGALFVGIQSGPTDHRHTVSETADPSWAEQTEFYYQYENLSSGAQDVFKETVESDSAVYTSEPAGSEFNYPGGSGFELYVIEYQNITYLFETGIDPSPLQPVLTGSIWISGIVGVILVLLGGFRLVTTARE